MGKQVLEENIHTRVSFIIKALLTWVTTQDPDPKSPGKCYCQSYLYWDTPDEGPYGKRAQGYLMDEADIQLGGAPPLVGKMVEVQLLMPSGEEKWCVTF